MANLGYGYGSKWHLLRYLGYHRGELDRRVEVATGGRIMQWLDFPFDAHAEFLDGEWKGLDFLTEDMAIKEEWSRFWPQTGNVPNWDAVAWTLMGDRTDLLLVEAKAHTGELRSDCRAKEEGGLSRISSALEEAKAAFRVSGDPDWLSPYYQYCNRLATLWFLVNHGVSARLLFIYFVGDENPNADCPKDESAWRTALDEMYGHVGLTGASQLERRVRTLFLPVCPD